MLGRCKAFPEDGGGTLSDKIEGGKARHWYLKWIGGAHENAFSYEILLSSTSDALFMVHTHGRYVS